MMPKPTFHQCPEWLKALVIGSSLSLLWLPAAFAQSAALTQAEVYRLQNVVNLIPDDQDARPARLQDNMVPRDAMRTGHRSRAELLFNEGSVARIGSRSNFRFVEGIRRYQLPDGSERAETVLQLQSGIAMVTSGAGGGDDTQIAMSMQTGDSELQQMSHQVSIIIAGPDGTTIISLTDGNFVSDLQGGNRLQLFGGQKVTIKDGVFGPVETFDLQQLYRTSQLTAGLGPDDENELADEPEGVQTTLAAVRANTLRAIAAQDETLQGLCTLDARGSDSTLASNCITSGVDDPLTEFEDNREDIPTVNEDPVILDPVPNPTGGQQQTP